MDLINDKLKVLEIYLFFIRKDYVMKFVEEIFFGGLVMNDCIV